MKGQRILLAGLVLALAIVTGLLYGCLTPRSFAEKFSEQRPLYLCAVECEAVAGTAQNTSHEITLQPGTEQYHRLMALLEQYRWRRTLAGLLSKQNGAVTSGEVVAVTIRYADGAKGSIQFDSNGVVENGGGRMESEQARQLTQELLELFREQ